MFLVYAPGVLGCQWPMVNVVLGSSGVSGPLMKKASSVFSSLVFFLYLCPA
jgi:hypothetical protein